MESRILYFDKGGKHNTEQTLQVAFERAKALGIGQVVLASSHGYTAKLAHSIFGPDFRLIAVSICASYADKGWSMTDEERQAVETLGIPVLTSIHALGDDVNEAFDSAPANRIVRQTLYTFSQGMKVAVEVALMAADAGLLDMSEEAIAIAGSDEGADTAVVIKPAYCRHFKDLRILEILAKPR